MAGTPSVRHLPFSVVNESDPLKWDSPQKRQILGELAEDFKLLLGEDLEGFDDLENQNPNSIPSPQEIPTMSEPRGPLFGENPSEDVHTWIATVGILFESAEVADDGKRFLKAIALLRGSAAIWYHETYTGDKTWSALSKAINLALDPKGQLKAWDEVMSLTQGGLSLEAYTNVKRT